MIIFYRRSERQIAIVVSFGVTYAHRNDFRKTIERFLSQRIPAKSKPVETQRYEMYEVETSTVQSKQF